MRSPCLVVLLLLAAPACDADEPCHSDERFEDGACIEESPDNQSRAGRGGNEGGEGGNQGGEGGNQGGEDRDAAAEQDAASETCSEEGGGALGDDCTAETPCNCDAPYCAIQPTATMGFCTVYCPEGDCPDGYRCFDLSSVGVSGYEPFCIPE